MINPFNVSVFILRVVTSKINIMEVGQVSEADSQRSVEDTTMHNLQSIGSLYIVSFERNQVLKY